MKLTQTHFRLIPLSSRQKTQFIIASLKDAKYKSCTRRENVFLCVLDKTVTYKKLTQSLSQKRLPAKERKQLYYCVRRVLRLLAFHSFHHKEIVKDKAFLIKSIPAVLTLTIQKIKNEINT